MQPIATPASSGFSPPIAITLEVNGSQYSVGELGPDYLVVEEAKTIDPALGLLIVTVGEQSITRRIRLPQGIRPDLPRSPLIVIDTAVPAVAVGTG